MFSRSTEYSRTTGRDSNLLASCTRSPSGSKRDPNRGIIEEFPFGAKIRVNPDRLPDPLVGLITRSAGFLDSAKNRGIIGLLIEK